MSDHLHCPWCAGLPEVRYAGEWLSHPYNKCALAGIWFRSDQWNKRAAEGGSKVHVVIEMADVELSEVHVFTEIHKAESTFVAIAQENSLIDWAPEDMKREVDGTVRIAGDDSCSVQLITKEVK